MEEKKLERQNRSRWNDPLIIAISTAAIALVGNILLALINQDSDEKMKEKQLLGEIINNKPQELHVSLLEKNLDLGIIQDPVYKQKAISFILKYKPAQERTAIKE